MSSITITAGERGVIRVFAISRPIGDVRKALEEDGAEALAAGLLGHEVAEDQVEIFPVTDLAGVGLPSYLTDGHGIPEARIGNDKGRLDALDGYVMLLFSSAFDGAAVALNPGRDLTLIGSYRQERLATSAPPIESEAAKPQTGVPDMTPPPAPKGRAGGAMIGLGLLVIAALLLFWILL